MMALCNAEETAELTAELKTLASRLIVNYVNSIT